MNDTKISVHELKDEPDRTYVFGFPADAPAKQVEAVSAAIQDRLEEANVLLFAGNIEGDMALGELDADEIKHVGGECPECGEEPAVWADVDGGLACEECGYLDEEDRS